jgi:hypothetical protein
MPANRIADVSPEDLGSEGRIQIDNASRSGGRIEALLEAWSDD